MLVNKLLKLKCLITVFYVAFSLSGNSYAQTSYYQGQINSDASVLVDNNVLDQLGAAVDLNGLLNKRVILPQTIRKPLHVSPLSLKPLNLGNNVATPTSAMEIISNSTKPIAMKITSATKKTETAKAKLKAIKDKDIAERKKAKLVVEKAKIIAAAALEIENSKKNKEKLEKENKISEEIKPEEIKPEEIKPEEINQNANDETPKDIAAFDDTSTTLPVSKLETIAKKYTPAENKIAAIDDNVVSIHENGNISIRFNENSQDLLPKASAEMEELTIKLKNDENLRIQLWGYAKVADGSPSQSRRLSLFRAFAVRTYLMKKGIRSTRMDIRALGSKSSDGYANRVDVIFP